MELNIRKLLELLRNKANKELDFYGVEITNIEYEYSYGESKYFVEYEYDNESYSTKFYGDSITSKKIVKDIVDDLELG